MSSEISINLPFKFYKFTGAQVGALLDLGQQQRNRQVCEGCPPYHMVTDIDRLPSFMFTKPNDGLPAVWDSIELIEVNTGAVIDIQADVEGSGHLKTWQDAADTEYWHNDSAIALTTVIPCGIYYVLFERTLAGGEPEWYYSELVSFEDFSLVYNPILKKEPHTKFEFTSSSDFAGIPFSSAGFTCTFHLKNTIVEPATHTLEREVTELTDGSIIPKSQLVRKTVNITTDAVGLHIIEGLFLMAIADTAYITPEGETSDLRQTVCKGTMEILEDPAFDGCIGLATISYEPELAAYNSNCNDQIAGFDCIATDIPDVLSIQFANSQNAIELATPNVGDRYLIVDDGSVIFDWVNHINEIGEWVSGGGWTYTVPVSLDATGVTTPTPITPTTCTDILEGATVVFDSGCWRDRVELESVTNLGSCEIEVKGWVPAGMWVEVWRKPAAGSYSKQATITRAQFLAGFAETYFAPETWDVKVKAVNYVCDLGFSRELQVICA